MKKAIAILLTALLLLTVFVSCEGDIEDMFGKTVSFNGNGSTSGQMAEMKVKKGEEVTLPANEFTRTDYVFAGWNTQADGSGTGYADKAKASFDDNTVLYAQWAEELTITFNANDGSETPETTTQEVEKDVETALAANSFTSPDVNYVFAGWTTDKAGEKTYYGDKESVTLTENITLYAQWGSPLNVDATTWEDGLTYTLVEGVTISSARIDVNGNVRLFIPNGKTLTASMGITVTGDHSLTINGKGSLVATEAVTANSGIGGIDVDGKRNCGTVIINGGTVTANGGMAAAGIGGGYNGAGGTIDINGGTVTANGGMAAAGIGGGRGGKGGEVTINGGTVYATGASYGAGIGSGDAYESTTVGTVTINGGTVTANGGSEAAGIGGGWRGAGETVTINGGTVIANGGNLAAGIGGGWDGNGGKVTINGGTVTATGGSANEYYGPGAGIGGGCNGAGGTVAINGGTVTATGGSGSVKYPVAGTGIGAGSDISSHGTLEIGTGMALYGDETSPAKTKISDATESYTGDRYRYMLAKQPGN